MADGATAGPRACVLRSGVSVEVLEYRFEVRGAPAGGQVVRTRARAEDVHLEVDATFDAPVGDARVQQLSRSDPDDHHSHAFVETTKDRSGERKVRVAFDAEQGLVVMKRGDDQADVPYVEPFRDPLSMLHELRHADPDRELLRIPMLGNTVEAHLVETREVATDLGPVLARGYQLFPGGSRVWIEVAEPHRVAKVRQRTPSGVLDAILVREEHDTRLPGWDAESGAGRKRGRRRRRRGRGGRSRSKNRSSSA